MKNDFNNLPTLEFSDLKFCSHNLRSYARLLLYSGFRVLVYNPDLPLKSFTFELENSIGYCEQNGRFENIFFSTRHKPGKHGTGFLIDSKGIEKPDISNALDSFVSFPKWENLQVRNEITKYMDLQDYFNTPGNQVLKYYDILPPKKVQGMTVNIFKHKGESYSNCGISESFDSVLLVGEGIPKLSNPGFYPLVMIENHYKHYYRAIEVNEDLNPINKGKSPMFGGCFIECSDSRFPVSHPVSLHDRFE
jgi:hypothetical protein